MSVTAMPGGNPFFQMINGLVDQVRADWGNVHEIRNDLGILGVEYTKAADSEEPEFGDYADIGLMLPDGVHVVTDGDTYGPLYGIRIWRDNSID
jgi:hypothetical protein